MVRCEEIIAELQRRTHELKTDYYYPEGYSIRITTIGTGGFLPETYFNIGQAFSSDAYFFADDSQNLEINLLRSLFYRFSTFVHRISGKILALNNCEFDNEMTVCDFELPASQRDWADCENEVQFYVNDVTSNF